MWDILFFGSPLPSLSQLVDGEEGGAARPVVPHRAHPAPRQRQPVLGELGVDGGRAEALSRGGDAHGEALAGDRKIGGEGNLN